MSTNPTLPTWFRCVVAAFACAWIVAFGVGMFPKVNGILAWTVFALAMVIAFNGRLALASLAKALAARYPRKRTTRTKHINGE